MINLLFQSATPIIYRALLTIIDFHHSTVEGAADPLVHVLLAPDWERWVQLRGSRLQPICRGREQI